MEPEDPEPTRRFSDRAQDYARFRPDYPAAALAAIVAGLAPPSRLEVVDVGAGTGILSRQLAELGSNVIAVEPNQAMRSAAEPHPRITWAEGTAEATGLPGGSCDAVTAGQAFHWFRVPETLAEFQRVLRPAGRLAILWNHRSRVDEFTVGYRRALEAIDGEAPAERSKFVPDVVTSTGRFTNPRKLEFEHTQALSLEDLLGRALSTSTVPRSGPRTEALRSALRALHARHRGSDGRATMVYRTAVHLWDRSG